MLYFCTRKTKMTLKILFLFLTLKSVLVLGDNWDCVDYYWRDYYGAIPDDAVPAGKDHNNDILYIGLVYIKNAGFFPGTIYPRLETIRTLVDGTVYNTDQYVKILCSTHKEAFEWVPTESKDLNTHLSRNVIPGGSKINENLYIGRVFRNNDVIIGKVFRHEANKGGIRFPLTSTTVSNSLEYEILIFDCNKVRFDINLRLDVDEQPETRTY